MARIRDVAVGLAVAALLAAPCTGAAGQPVAAVTGGHASLTDAPAAHPGIATPSRAAAPATAPASPPGPADRGAGWSFYGGDAGGHRFSAAREITPANVAGLVQAWSFSTGDMTTKAGAMKRASSPASSMRATKMPLAKSVFMPMASSCDQKLGPATAR